MGREIKRVPLDFDWALEKVWAGYINPYYTATKCEHCDGSGLSVEARRLSDEWYGYAPFDPASTGSELLTTKNPAVRAFAKRNVTRGGWYYGSGEAAIEREAARLCGIWNTKWSTHLEQADVDALIAAGRLSDFTRNGIEHPTAQQVNEWNITPGHFGHDSLNQYVCVKAKCERLGYPHLCEHCNGNGRIWRSEAERQRYDEWQPTEPPTGDGWQVWETVSEGSPVSPVFATADALVDWLVQQGHDRNGAQAFVVSKYSPSLILSSNGVESGIDALAHLTRDTD